MGLIHKSTCENLKRKTKAMYDIDNQEDDAVDAMLVYAPKRAKVSSLESLYSETTNKEIYNEKKSHPILFVVIGLVLAGIAAFVIVSII